MIRTLFRSCQFASVVFLDDCEYRTAAFKAEVPEAYTVTTAEETINKLQYRPVGYLFLDHDLGGGSQMDSSRSDTGMEVVRWIVQNKPQIHTIVVHTMNFDACGPMTKALYEAGYRVLYVPFGRLIPQYRGV